MRGLVFVLGFAAIRVLGADDGIDEERRWNEIEPLLEGVARKTRQGDLHSAWSDYRQAFELAGASELLALRRAVSCRGRCPPIWDLAWLLGKPRSDLDFLDGICPDGGDHRCRRWRTSLREARAYLGDGQAEPPAPQRVELELLHAAEYEDLRPWVVVEVGGTVTWAMVDTGAGTAVSFGADWASEAALDFQLTGASHLTMDTDGVVRRRRLAMLSRFGLGTLRLEMVPAVVRQPPDPYVFVGMRVLLRYDAVCFEWPTDPSERGTLHLGALGPCASGAAADGEFLDSVRWQPQIAVAIRNSPSHDVLVDTGSWTTDCKEEFMERHGDSPMRFGTHPALVARCELATQYPVLPSYPWPVIFGMDTLIQFDAFGWELNPFRMYFVPASGS